MYGDFLKNHQHADVPPPRDVQAVVPPQPQTAKKRLGLGRSHGRVEPIRLGEMPELSQVLSDLAKKDRRSHGSLCSRNDSRDWAPTNNTIPETLNASREWSIPGVEMRHVASQDDLQNVKYTPLKTTVPSQSCRAPVFLDKENFYTPRKAVDAPSSSTPAPTRCPLSALPVDGVDGVSVLPVEQALDLQQSSHGSGFEKILSGSVQKADLPKYDRDGFRTPQCKSNLSYENKLHLSASYRQRKFGISSAGDNDMPLHPAVIAVQQAKRDAQHQQQHIAHCQPQVISQESNVSRKLAVDVTPLKNAPAHTPAWHSTPVNISKQSVSENVSSLSNRPPLSRISETTPLKIDSLAVPCNPPAPQTKNFQPAVPIIGTAENSWSSSWVTCSTTSTPLPADCQPPILAPTTACSSTLDPKPAAPLPADCQAVTPAPSIVESSCSSTWLPPSKFPKLCPAINQPQPISFLPVHSKEAPLDKQKLAPNSDQPTTGRETSPRLPQLETNESKKSVELASAEQSPHIHSAEVVAKQDVSSESHPAVHVPEQVREVANAAQSEPKRKQVEPQPKPCTVGQGQILVNGLVYTIVGLLGRGGSSKVYEVKDLSSPQSKALKCVNLADTDQAICNGYLNEIKMLADLQDGHCVIRMFDFEHQKDKKMLFVVMEKGEKDLSTFLKEVCKSRKISAAMIVYYWTEMLNAVNFIHQRGIIHSDLKPANFLLVSGYLKLIDFGIASSVQEDMTSVMKDCMTGTYSYISPEALSATDGKGYKISYKSDVWSLGCILYNLVYGHTPFQNIPGQFQKLNAIVNPSHKIQFPNPPIEGCPPALINAMKMCLVRNPKERASVDELLQISYFEHVGPERGILSQIARLAASEGLVSGSEDNTENLKKYSIVLLSIQRLINEHGRNLSFLCERK